MPCHARVDDEVLLRPLERAQAVVYFAVDLGVRLHVLVELKGGHAHFQRDGALYGAGGIHLRTETRGEQFAHRRFSAAEVARKGYFHAFHMFRRLC